MAVHVAEDEVARGGRWLLHVEEQMDYSDKDPVRY